MDMTTIHVEVDGLLHYIEMINWCNDNNIDHPEVIHGTKYSRFLFVQEQDAILFALRWA
jgi:hypothetical protein